MPDADPACQPQKGTTTGARGYAAHCQVCGYAVDAEDPSCWGVKEEADSTYSVSKCTCSLVLPGPDTVSTATVSGVKYDESRVFDCSGRLTADPAALSKECAEMWSCRGRERRLRRRLVAKGLPTDGMGRSREGSCGCRAGETVLS